MGGETHPEIAKSRVKPTDPMQSDDPYSDLIQQLNDAIKSHVTNETHPKIAFELVSIVEILEICKSCDAIFGVHTLECPQQP